MDKKQTYQLAIEGARFYEENFVPALFTNWAKTIVEKLALKPADHLLDIACGTGIVARTAKASEVENLQVTGSDINDGMLQVAKEIEPAIEWVKGSAENLPFNDHSFEKISCQFGFMFFQDQTKSLNEMLRVKKNNGRIVLGIWDVIEANEGYNDLLQIIENIGGSDLGQILRAPFNLGNKEELVQIIQSSNVTHYKIETIKNPVEFPSIDHFIDCDVKASPIAEKITDEQYHKLLNEARTKLGKYVTSEGKVRFHTSGHIITIT